MAQTEDDLPTFTIASVKVEDLELSCDNPSEVDDTDETTILASDDSLPMGAVNQDDAGKPQEITPHPVLSCDFPSSADDVHEAASDCSELISDDSLAEISSTKSESGKKQGITLHITRKKVKERNFACNVCGKKFLHEGHHKRHMKIHSKSCILPVNQSLKSVPRQTDAPVKSSLITVPGTSDPDSIMETSPIKNVRKNGELSLVDHRMNINRSFVCAVCGKGFGRKSHLKRHVKLHESTWNSVAVSDALKCNERIECLTPHRNTKTQDCFSDTNSINPRLPSNGIYKEVLEVNDELKSTIFVDPAEVMEDSNSSAKIKCEPLDKSSVPSNITLPEDKSVESTCPNEESECPSTNEDNEPISDCEENEHENNFRENEAPIVSDIGLDMGVDISDLPYADDALRVNKMISKEQNFECPYCHKIFNHESQLKRHVKLHTVTEHHECEVCGKRFTQKTYLKAHINIVHAVVKPVLNKILPCSICNKRFGRMSHLKRHMKMHTEGKTFSCHICGKSFSQNCNLKCHMRIHGDQKSSTVDAGLVRKYVNEETKAECFQCELCGKSFQQMSSLKAHINTLHVNSKVFDKCFECCFCGKKFGRNSHLKRHLKLHVGGVTFTCDLCGREFKQNGNLKAHIRMVHLKERSFQCTYCGKMFLQKSNLNTHIRTHTGEKPYECTLCGKEFTQGNQLKYHMRSHLGERPFSCTICGKKFTNNRSCRRHIKTHTDNKAFDCEICSKSFFQHNQLKVHMRMHTGEKPFDCSICGKEFTNKRGRDKHYKAHSKNFGVEEDDREFSDPYSCDEDADDPDRDFSEPDSYDEDADDPDKITPVHHIKEEIDVVVKEEPENFDDLNDYESNESGMISSDVSVLDPLDDASDLGYQH